MVEGDSSAENRLREQLLRLLQSIEASGHAVLPRTHHALLQSIVEAAARIFGAAAASIALVNEQDQTLDFMVSYGAGNESVAGMRIPLDKGIAGYVAMTGQPIATSRIKEDVRFNQDFAKSTGYVPDSILATPLLSGDRVIGVMEVLDKIKAPSFGIEDMELLALFANQAAIAIHQSQQYDRLDETLRRALQRMAQSEEGATSAELLQTLAAAGQPGAARDDLLALADLFYDISLLGEAERQTCLKVLAAFAEFGRSQAGFFHD